MTLHPLALSLPLRPPSTPSTDSPFLFALSLPPPSPPPPKLLHRQFFAFVFVFLFYPCIKDTRGRFQAAAATSGEGLEGGGHTVSLSLSVFNSMTDAHNGQLLRMDSQW